MLEFSFLILTASILKHLASDSRNPTRYVSCLLSCFGFRYVLNEERTGSRYVLDSERLGSTHLSFGWKIVPVNISNGDILIR